MAKKKSFPTFAVIVFVLAILWILGETGVIVVNVPWFPVIIAIIALGWIVNNYKNK